MKLPFFKSDKSDTKKIPHTPAPASHPTTPPVPPASRTAAPGTQPTIHPADMSETRPLFQSSKPAGTNVEIPVSCFLSQLPAQLFTLAAQSQIATLTVNIPQERVLPQLKTGRVTITLDELTKFMPAHLLRQPAPATNSQQTISLPLADVVAALPANAFAVEHESTLDLNSPELNAFPPLFDESLLEEPVAEELVASEPEPATEPAAAAPEPEPALEPEPVREVAPIQPPQPAPRAVAPPAPVANKSPVTAPAPVANEAADDLPAQIMVRLRSLVASMPDKLFIAPRTDLARVTDLEARVPIPFEPIQSQLQSARVRLPIDIVIAVMPSSLFKSPLPPLSGETVTIPLDEIVPQLSQRAFKVLFRQPQTGTVDISASIPTPFHEKSETAAVEVQPETPVAEPEPVATVTPAPQPPAELTAEDLESEDFAIFSEKAAPVTPVAPAAPKVEARQPEPKPVEKPEVKPEPPPQAAVPPAPPMPAPVVPVAEPVASEPPVWDLDTADAEPSEPEVEPLAAEMPAEPTHAAPATESGPADDRKFLINLNRCSAAELVRIQGIGPAMARRIVAAREERGGQFHSLEELRSVAGIGPKTYRALVGKEPRVLNRLLGIEHDQELSLQEVVRQISKLEGIAGCILSMTDGLLLTGQLPAHLDSEAVSVFAPQLFKRVGRYTREIRVGQVRRLTIFTDQQPMSIFQAGDIYLVIVHDPQRYSKALLRRCERISEEIAALCRQRAVV